jgi:hypothetical protein
MTKHCPLPETYFQEVITILKFEFGKVKNILVAIGVHVDIYIDIDIDF